MKKHISISSLVLVAGLLSITNNLFAQGKSIRKNRFPAGTFHGKDKTINGISGGIIAGFSETDGNVVTNGLRLELIGFGLLLPLIPKSPISEGDSLSVKQKQISFIEKVNGINISGSGTGCEDFVVNGLSVGAIGQYLYATNGLTVSIVTTLVDKHNGIQLSMFNETHLGNGMQLGLSNDAIDYKGIQVSVLCNHAIKARGIQVGLFNKSKNLKGLQFGLWNVNQKRKMPLINWNFKG